MAEIITVTTTAPDPDDPATPLDRIARLNLRGANKAWVGVYNNLPESITLNSFQVVFFGNANAEAVVGPDTAAEWTTPSSSKNVIQHGNPVSPVTLPAGQKMYFTLDNLAPMHSLQILATVASGEGKLKIEFNRGS